MDVSSPATRRLLQCRSGRNEAPAPSDFRPALDFHHRPQSPSTTAAQQTQHHNNNKYCHSRRIHAHSHTTLAPWLLLNTIWKYLDCHSTGARASIGSRTATACLHAGGFPSQVIIPGHTELHLSLPRSQVNLLLFHVRRHSTSLLLRAPPLPPTFALHHNHNGLNTTSSVAARSHSSNSYARSATRQLRAILPAPLQAHHRARQPLRFFPL